MRPALTQPRALSMHGLEEEVVVDAERSGPSAQRIGDEGRLGAREGERLLDQHGGARRQRPDREVGVRVGRRADVDHIGAFGREALVHVAVRSAAAERRGGAPRGTQVGIAEHERGAASEVAHGGRVRRSDAAAAHHGDLHAASFSDRRTEDACRIASGASRSALPPIGPSRGAERARGRPGQPDR